MAAPLANCVVSASQFHDVQEQAWSVLASLWRNVSLAVWCVAHHEQGRLATCVQQAT